MFSVAVIGRYMYGPVFLVLHCFYFITFMACDDRCMELVTQLKVSFALCVSYAHALSYMCSIYGFYLFFKGHWLHVKCIIISRIWDTQCKF